MDILGERFMVMNRYYWGVECYLIVKKNIMLVLYIVDIVDDV